MTVNGKKKGIFLVKRKRICGEALLVKVMTEEKDISVTEVSQYFACSLLPHGHKVKCGSRLSACELAR